MNINIIPKPNKAKLYKGKRKISDEDFELIKSDALPDEGYEILIDSQKAVITYNSESGLFYARQSLAQLKNPDGSYPHVAISDAPRFGYRAFMIDSARHKQTVDEIKTYIEAAARFKFNTFHWHLCDDQGWRIESEKYPELNRVGSYRDSWGFGSKRQERYGGYFTKAEIRDVVAYCKERFINVIPEIDIPGHSVAAIASYPYLSCRGEQLRVETRPGVHKDILCAGKESTFEFCFGILEEVIELFPYEYIHIGGDEAPKNRWNECNECKRRMWKEQLSNSEELQGYFVNRIVEFLKTKGKKAIAWNESLNSGMLDKSVIVCDWADREHRCEKFANNGGKIIIEEFFNYYLDYPYGMTPLKKTYTYDPLLKDLNDVGKKNVIGVETPIWTEFVEDFDRLCYMCFPRMMAVAETGWTNEEERCYKSFFERAEHSREMLSKLGINMADSKKWDPSPLGRVGGLVNHYKKFLTRDFIKSLIRPEKD